MSDVRGVQFQNWLAQMSPLPNGVTIRAEGWDSTREEWAPLRGGAEWTGRDVGFRYVVSWGPKLGCFRTGLTLEEAICNAMRASGWRV